MNKSEVVSKLKALREERKISINRIATMIGTSHTRVKKFEAGECDFLMDLILKYASAVGYQFDLVPVLKVVSIGPTSSNGNGVHKQEQPVERIVEPFKGSHWKGDKKQIIIEEQE